MKATFALALFTATVAARSPLGKLENNPQFVQFVSANNKNYKSHRELTQRAQIFQNNLAQIRQLN